MRGGGISDGRVSVRGGGISDWRVSVRGGGIPDGRVSVYARLRGANEDVVSRIVSVLFVIVFTEK